MGYGSIRVTDVRRYEQMVSECMRLSSNIFMERIGVYDTSESDAKSLNWWEKMMSRASPQWRVKTVGVKWWDTCLYWYSPRLRNYVIVRVRKSGSRSRDKSSLCRIVFVEEMISKWYVLYRQKCKSGLSQLHCVSVQTGILKWSGGLGYVIDYLQGMDHDSKPSLLMRYDSRSINQVSVKSWER